MTKGGTMYLTVFAYENMKHFYPRRDILLDYCLPKHKVIDKES